MLHFAPIFTDHLVLQREKPLHIWGTGGAGIVTVRLGEHTASAEVRDGRWAVVFPPLPAGGPLTLEATDGTELLLLTDVMIGEVWLCGGQSNMELALKDSADPEPALAACAESGVRLYHVGKRGFLDEQFLAEEAASQWQLPSAEACRHWTAIGYYTGAALAKKLGVTVGLVECNCGGTSVSAWMSEENLAQTVSGQKYLNDYSAGMQGLTDAEANKAYIAYCEYQNAWQKRADACYAENPAMPWSEVLRRCGENRFPGPCAPMNPMRPHGLYDTMVSRITPYTLRGVMYYQGESDDHRPGDYRTLLTGMIREWREEFRDPALPFLIVQLPMFWYAELEPATNWAEIRQAQAEVCRSVQNTALAVILDCGEFDNIHPKDKKTPAHRLYQLALREVYGMEVQDAHSPLLRDALPERGGMRVMFDHAESGLVLRGEDGFELCGADGQWHPARPQVQGETLYLSAPEVPYPVRARYAWTNYGAVSLFAENGLPAAPFVTA